MTLENTRVQVQLLADLVTALDLAQARVPLNFNYAQSFVDGSGASQANRIWHDRRTLAASATENHDLAGGALVDPFGATITFARIKAILVKAAAGNTNNVNVIREGTNGVPLFLAAADGIPVLPDGLFFWAAPGAAGVVVTAGTGDLLTITNSAGGTSVDYDIVVLGASV